MSGQAREEEAVSVCTDTPGAKGNEWEGPAAPPAPSAAPVPAAAESAATISSAASCVGVPRGRREQHVVALEVAVYHTAHRQVRRGVQTTAHGFSV
jgi:hypothetical protein